MKKIFCWLTCIVWAFVITACGDQRSSAPGKEKPVVEQTPAVQAIPAMGTGTDVPVDEKSTPTAFSGTVAETIDASRYTYIRLDDGSGKEIWVAVPRTDLRVGEKVLFRGGDMMLENFNSKALNRTFEKIIFATGVFRLDGKEISSVGTAGGSDEAAMQRGTGISGGSSANVVPFDGLKVEKATGPDAYAVGEIFEKASSLDGKHVVIRGRIVKFSTNIMGRNWIHIQDGTGDPDRNTCDLVVTTMDTAETGDIVTIGGQVAAPKDFGFGYKYDVIIEDARIGGIAEEKA